MCLELLARCLVWFCSLGEVLLPASVKSCVLSCALHLRKSSVIISEAYGYSRLSVSFQTKMTDLQPSPWLVTGLGRGQSPDIPVLYSSPKKTSLSQYQVVE